MKGFRAEYSPQEEIPPETTCRPTFQLSNLVCTTFADELRKRSIDGTEILIEFEPSVLNLFASRTIRWSFF